MYSLLLVDDEPLVRMAFKSLIDWEKHGFRIAYEAGNGAEALDIIRSMDIDILITDIRMPLMDGISLVREAKRLHPSLRVIILSAYGDFDLVKSSFKSGADDYFLKAESEPEELLQTVKSVASKIKEQLSLENKVQEVNEALQEEFIKKLAWGGRQDIGSADRISQQLGMKIHRENIAVIKLVLDETAEENSCSFMEYSNRCTGKDEVHNYSIYMARLSSTEFLMMYSQSREYSQSNIFEMFNGLNYGVPCFIGVSDIINTLSDFRRAYRQAAIAAAQARLMGAKKPVFYMEIIPKYSAKKEGVDLEKVLKAVELLDVEKAHAEIAKVRSIIYANYYESITELYPFFIKLIYDINALMDQKGVDLHFIIDEKFGFLIQIYLCQTVEEILGLVSEVICEIIEYIKDCEGNFCSSLVMRARNYIMERFNRKITVEEISEYLSISPSHFSKVFKKETGLNFTHYVNGIRIKKAKELMKKTCKRFYEISSEVGFDSPEYFFRIFKRIEGISPNEYKSLNKIVHKNTE